MRAKRVTLIAVDPDGGRHTVRTAAGYRWAALARVGGAWTLVTRGFSYDSTLSRAHTAAGRDVHVEMARFGRADRVVPAVVREYLAARPGGPVTEPPMLRSVFYQGQGWQTVAARPVDSALLRSLGDRVTDVSIMAGTVHADFTVEELLRP